MTPPNTSPPSVSRALRSSWHPVETLLLTQRGWRSLAEIEPGERLLEACGRLLLVRGVEDRSPSEMYRLEFDDQARSAAFHDQEWRLIDRRGNVLLFTTRELAEGRADAHRPLRSPLLRELNLEDRPRPLDPYLLGVILGGASPRAAAETPSGELLERVAERLIAGRANGEPAADLVQAMFEISAALVALGLRARGPTGLFLPTDYLLQSGESRMALLRGILDAGGAATPTSERRPSCLVTLEVYSPELADGVVQLVRSLGGLARRHVVSSSSGRDWRWRLSISMPPGRNPFSVADKAARWRRVVPPYRRLGAVSYLGQASGRRLVLDLAASPASIADGGGPPAYILHDWVLAHARPQ